ncbi:MAG: hypothetical protein H6719_27295 [Sandaracinaceae bacterium]|nr:hypothetical protein [Sandaracinaceae bacterium]
MNRVLLAVALIVASPAIAAAQDLEPDPIPSPDEPSDEDLIRWASREVGRQAGRSIGEHPPVPPDPYLGTGAGPELHLPDEEGRLVLRLLAETGGGLLGVGAGGGLGALLVWAFNEGNASPDALAIAWGAAVILGSLGVTGGVTLTADWMGGRGNFGHAFLGQLVGAVAALPLVALGLANDSPALALVAAGLLPLAGAILGYEIGHMDRAGAGGPTAYVVPTMNGALAGVAGPLP